MNNNKTIIQYISILLILLLIIPGCIDLDEDPKGLLSEETFYKTGEDLEAATIAVYSEFQGAFFINHSSSGLVCGDDWSSLKAGFSDFDKFVVKGDNGNHTWVWDRYWNMIYSSNAVINNYDKANISEAEKTKFVAQARFFRGLAYFFLVRQYGTVPLITSTQTTGNETLASFEEIYTLLIEDLKFASENLPVSWPQNEQAKISKYAAKSFLAIAYLTSTGFPIKNTSNFTLAAETAKEVIDNGGYELEENFADLWRGSSNDNNNAEYVFEIQYCKSCNGGWYPLSHNRMGKANWPSTKSGGWGELFAEIGFFESFPEGPRKDATFTTEVINVAGETIQWPSFTEGHPFCKKWFIWDEDTNAPLMRYAEVLLIYAEAMTAGGTTTNPNALEAINMVKRRAAGLPINIPNVSVDFTVVSQDDVILERKWELACEWSRWFDIIRMEQVNAIKSNRHPEDNQTSSESNITSSNPWFPIPDKDTQRNSNLVK